MWLTIQLNIVFPQGENKVCDLEIEEEICNYSMTSDSLIYIMVEAHESSQISKLYSTLNRYMCSHLISYFYRGTE